MRALQSAQACPTGVNALNAARERLSPDHRWPANACATARQAPAMAPYRLKAAVAIDHSVPSSHDTVDRRTVPRSFSLGERQQVRICILGVKLAISSTFLMVTT